MKHGVLIAEEELGALPFGNVRDFDRPADGAAKLVAVDVIRRGREKGPRVEVAIAQELKRVAMKAAAAGFGDDVDHRAGALTVRGVVVAGLNAEFLYRVGERERRIDVGHFIHVVAAVQEVVRLVRQRSVSAGDDRSRECLPISLVDPIALVGGIDHSSHQRDQRGCISAVQRKIDDASLVDDLRQGASLGVHLRQLAGNGDGLRRRSNFQSDIGGQLLIGLQHDVGLGIGLKTRCGNRQRIDGGRQSWEYEVPLAAGCDDRLPARLGLDSSYSGGRHRSAGRIGDRSGDSSIALGVKAWGGKSDEQQCGQRQSDVAAAFNAI